MGQRGLGGASRLQVGEDEDRKLKAEAKRGENIQTSDKSKEKIQRLLSSSPPSLSLSFCFIFAFILVFVSRLIFFFWQWPPFPRRGGPRRHQTVPFLCFFPHFHPHHKGMGLIKKREKYQEGLSAEMQIIQNVCTVSAPHLKHAQCVTTGVGGG